MSQLVQVRVIGTQRFIDLGKNLTRGRLTKFNKKLFEDVAGKE